MSDKDKHMALYSSSDIEKYLSGEMSDPEMHALERAALDDPFLADALEGMSVHRSLPGQPVFTREMAELQKRLEDRTVSVKTGRVRLLPLVARYAAAVILLLGLGTTAYFGLFSKKMKDAPLSKNEVRPVTQDRAASQTQVPPIKPAGTDADREVVRNDKKAQKALRLRVADTPYTAAYQRSLVSTDTKEARDASLPYRNDLSTGAKQPGAPAYSNTSRYANTYDIYKNSQRPLFGDSGAFYRDSPAYNLNGRVAGMQSEGFDHGLFDKLVVRGKVINPQNTPLAGATVTLKGYKSYMATTDKDGYFSFKLAKKDSVSGVVVNYAGYEPGFTTLNTEDKTGGNIIKLKPQSLSLNEVVVVGYGSKRKELTRSDINSRPLPLSQVAVPAEGWPAYTNYLELNKLSPEVDTTIRGYESISFLVNKKGELSSFKVEQSLSPAHDSLVIRLIKQGPSWKTLSGKKERARVVLTW